MKIEFDKPIDVIYEIKLKELCEYYDWDPENVIKQIISMAHQEKIRKEEN